LKKSKNIRIELDKYEAAILDMDGVITRSARTHMAAWKHMFDDYLHKRADRSDVKFEPFSDEDYYLYVDGKPRYEGAQSFLESRKIALPYGSPDDPPGKETICGLGNRKNQYFLEYLKKNGVESYPSTIDFVKELKTRNKRVAAISSSRNAKEVLETAGVSDLFHVVVDGIDADEYQLKGKPEPDIFLEAAKRLNVNPKKAIVVEDAISGIEAGRAGGFGLVIGINRSGQNTELKNRGADIVVVDLSELKSENDENYSIK
jgi:trehalose 6-phosphate phosphatase